MRGIAYIRVSTREQDEENQRRAIEEFARARNIEILKYYIDKGESGAKSFRERPAAKHLLEELDSLKPDIIIAWSLDRIGRIMLDTLQSIIELERRAIGSLRLGRNGCRASTIISGSLYYRFLPG